MPRQPISMDWIQEAEAHFADGLGPTLVTRRLEELAGSGKYPADPPPGKRSIERLYQQYKDAIRFDPDKAQSAAFLHWPQSMGTALPWEASGAALELIGYRERKGKGRPTVRHTAWYWRLLVACPRLDRDQAHDIAAHLATREFIASRDPKRAGVLEVVGLEVALARAIDKQTQTPSDDWVVLENVETILSGALGPWQSEEIDAHRQALFG